MDLAGLLRKEIDRKRKAGLSLKRKRPRSNGSTAAETSQTEPPKEAFKEGEKKTDPEEDKLSNDAESVSRTSLSQTEVVEDTTDALLNPSVNPGNAREELVLDSIVDSLDHSKASEKKDLTPVSGNDSKSYSNLPISFLHKYSAYIQREDAVNLIISSDDILEVNEKLPLQIRKFFKDLLGAWTNNCTSRYPPPMLLETKRDLVKLMYKLRSNKLDDDVLVSLATIVHYIQTERFEKASEAYLQLSIGNVAWPIGVRDVGIHARAADAKIAGSDNQKLANIMKGESTRRWLVAVKRLISYSQSVGGQ